MFFGDRADEPWYPAAVSRRWLVGIGIAAALAIVVVVVVIVHASSSSTTAAAQTAAAQHGPAASAPQPPSIGPGITLPVWARPVRDRPAVQETQAPIIPLARNAQVDRAHSADDLPPVRSGADDMRAPAVARRDPAAGEDRLEAQHGPLSKTERLAFEAAHAKAQKPADKVPGTTKMRQTVLASQCTGPAAQEHYHRLATDAEREQMRRRCAPFGFQPVP